MAVRNPTKSKEQNCPNNGNPGNRNSKSGVPSYQLTGNERLKILANLVIDRIIKDFTKNKLKDAV